MSKEDRREKDAAVARRMTGQRKRKAVPAEESHLKPGDPDWVGRARVPMPDTQVPICCVINVL